MAPNSTPAATSIGIMLGSATRLVTKCGGALLCARCSAAALSADMPALHTVLLRMILASLLQAMLYGRESHVGCMCVAMLESAVWTQAPSGAFAGDVGGLHT